MTNNNETKRNIHFRKDTWSIVKDQENINRFVNDSILFKSDLLKFLKANPKTNAKQLTEYLKTL